MDAQWRASKLKYYLDHRALQQVFDYIQEHNRSNLRFGVTKFFPGPNEQERFHCQVEGIARTQAMLLLAPPQKPQTVQLDGQPVESVRWDDHRRLLWLQFPNQAQPGELDVR